jgi:tetratricopeptide (TPR) repeat protein
MTRLLLFTGLLSGTAYARMEKPAIGPAPDWVKPVALPARPEKADEAPVRVVLADQQVRIEPGKVMSYVDLALGIQTPQGLAAGNLSFPWNPETDEVTVHKLVIHRDGKDIDILASGQTFTVVRRETNLEIATLDGMLTANIQPEGLQVGDVLEYAFTMSHADPVFRDHVEQSGATWNGLPFARAHMSVQWPSSMAVSMRQAGALPALKPVKAGATTSVEISLDNVQPTLPPRLAPARYGTGRVIEFSNFKSWADLGALMAPLYAKAAVIPAQGPLRDEVEKIKAASADPVKRTEAALALVQDRVRYVALLMGAGGYVPATAEETWSRRYGDCKAKSALLLAVLGELGVAAEPVAANAISGDGIADRLPMIGLFNHVLVRAHVGGADYWLDGTRQGDTSLARLKVPDFGWSLPLVAKGAALVKMVPAPLDKPADDIAIEIDARQGLTLPASFKATIVLRGDGAIATRLSLNGMAQDARERSLRQYWKDQFDFVDVTKTDATYDAATGEETLAMQGMAHMEWKDGWYQTDKTGVGYDADFARTDGTNRDAPFAVNFPSYSRTVETIKLPPGFASDPDIASARVDQTVGGYEYHRKASLIDGVFRIDRSERSVVPEFPASDAAAAQKTLRELADNTISLRRPDNLQMTEAEIKATLATTPQNVPALIERGSLLLDQNKQADAVVDFSDALEKEPKNVTALANRAFAYIGLGETGKAKTDIDAAQAIDPDNVLAWEARGLLAVSMGDPKKAADAYSRAIAQKPDDFDAYGHRVFVLREIGDLDGALKDSAWLLAKDPNWIELRALRAGIYRIKGDNAAALSEADRLGNGERASARMLIQAGLIYNALDLREKAVAAYDRAIAVAPSVEAYLLRSRAREKGDYPGRMADLDAGLKYKADDLSLLLAKADLLIESGKAADAIEIYNSALANRQNAPTVLLQRAIAYARTGNEVLAQKDFSAARGVSKDPMWLNNFCWAKGTAGVALESALTDCDEALAKAPDSPEANDSRGFVLLRLGRFDDAVAAYSRALATQPYQSASLFGRAIAWSRKGDLAKAKADRDAAFRLDPDIEKRFEGYGVTMPAATP